MSADVAEGVQSSCVQSERVTAGVRLFSDGKLADALSVFEEAYQEGEIDLRRFKNLQAVIFLGAGKVDSAVEAIDVALVEAPADVETLVNATKVYLVANGFDRVVQFFLKLCKLDAAPAELTYNVIDVLSAVGNFEILTEVIEEFIALHDELENEFCLRAANVYAELQDYTEAGYFIGLVSLKGATGEVRSQLASLYFKCRMIDEGSAIYESLLESDPGSEIYLIDYGTYLFRSGYIQKSLGILGKCCELYPRSAVALQNMGVALREYGDIAGAAAHLKRAEDCWSDDPLVSSRDISKNEILLNKFIVDYDLDSDGVRLDALDEILIAEPGNHQARWHRAMIRLARGNFAGGWDDYRSRWRSDDAIKRPYSYPVWKGGSDHGQLLVYAEQGVGDEIMFASCLPQLKTTVNRVVVECDCRLLHLYRRSFPSIEFIGRLKSKEDVLSDKTLCGVSAQLPIGDLPLYYRRTVESFLNNVPYLVVSTTKIKKWRKILEDYRGRRLVGLSWRGGTKRTRAPLRSLSTSDLESLFSRVEDVVWVSLQYGNAAEEVEEIRAKYGVTILHFEEMNEDFDELAALVSNLESVVSVQTAIVHLCGALNKTVHCLLPKYPEWRYRMQNEGSSLWYPSVNLYSKGENSAWAPLLKKIGDKYSENNREILC